MKNLLHFVFTVVVIGLMFGGGQFLIDYFQISKVLLSESELIAIHIEASKPGRPDAAKIGKKACFRSWQVPSD